MVPGIPEHERVDQDLPQVTGTTMLGRVIYQKIGKGSFGQVYAAQNMRTGQAEVVKVVPKSQAAMREIHMQHLLPSHSNIVELLDAFSSRRNMYMFLTYGGSRNLFHCIARQMYSFDESLDVFAKISDAVIFMHDCCHVCHLDIKPENVLVDDHDEPRIADFGAAGRTDELIEYNAGSLPFAAPEILSRMPRDRNSRPRSEVIGYQGDLADVFSMGIILLEMLQGNNYVMHQLGWAGTCHSALLQDPGTRSTEMMDLLQDGTRLEFLKEPLLLFGGLRYLKKSYRHWM